MTNERGFQKQEVDRKWVQQASGGRVMAFYPGLVEQVGGVKAALLLCQLLYWSSLPAEKWARQQEGWVYKGVEDMQRETGLSKCEQQTARKALLAVGVIEAQLRGIPRTWYYRVNMPRLAELMGCAVDLGLPESGDPPAGSDRPADGTGCDPTPPPLDADPAQRGEQTVPTLGGIPAQLNKELKPTAENTREIGEPRSSQWEHPAVVVYKTVTGLYPARAVLNLVIRALGDAPDAARFARVHEAWCARGYRVTNLAGQLDWYHKGIPEVVLPSRAGMPAPRRLEEGPRSAADLEELRSKLRAVR